MSVSNESSKHGTGIGPDLLARAFNAAPNGFLIVDATGTIIAVNSELEAMFGMSSADMIGQPLEMLLPETLRHSHVGLRQSFFEKPDRRPMGAGRVLYARRANGVEFPVEIGLNPIAGDQGELVLASVVDISERMALEWAFRGLFDESPYGLLIVNDQGDIVMVNKVLARSLGYSQSALINQPLSMLLPERYRAAHGTLMSGYAKTGEARMMGQGRDLTALHSDGTEVPVEIGLSRVRWQRQMMTLAVISDISVRKRLEAELKQANANLEEFTYVASHDLRSPLRGIADLTEWIEADLGEEVAPEVARNLLRIKQRIERMERLIDDLLLYARAGQASTQYSQIQLSELLKGTLDLQPIPEGFRIDLDVNVTPFQGVRVPLETVLRNLISNAIKHHDQPSGTIRVNAREDDSYCVIRVIDDGPGVPSTAKTRIFKLFQTLTASQRGNAGIGLALTKRLVEVHGGRIDVTSPVEGGRGACFQFWWPRFPRRNQYES
ncbi:MAG TPA: PAS domain-containing sensor histidine kinase [Aquabacterium sp.]|nr:PAS domain-containing sensor histidine kinase [Aquabacterium sp.]